MLRVYSIPILIALTMLMFSACYIVMGDECDIAAGEINGIHAATPPSGMVGTDPFSAIMFIIDINEKFRIADQVTSRN